MSGQAAEKVGVIVIHGVGPTSEGWIDGYLIPELEKWHAYDRVGGIARLDESHDLIFQAKSRDGKWLAVGLGDDDDFANFARAIGMPLLKNDPQFADRESRLENRDALFELVEQTFAKQDWSPLLAALRKNYVPSTQAFRPESEVYRVRDPEATDPARTWRSFTRRWPLGTRDVVVTEMFWADLSFDSRTVTTRVLALIELFLEAPFVLGRAFLSGSLGPFENLIRKLILLANWLIRWPIAGLNAAIFSACFAAMVLQQFERFDLLPEVVIGTLLVVAFAGLWGSLELHHKRPGIADIGLATFVCGIGLACLVGGAWMMFGGDAMSDPSGYLNVSIRLILLCWFLWTLLNVTAVIIVTLLGIGRAFGGAVARKPDGSTFSEFKRIVPLARSSAAIGLGILIGIIWKLVLSVLGVLVIASLGQTRDAQVSQCAAQKSLLEIATDTTDICQLYYAEQQLINVRDLNIAAALLVAFAIFLVHRWRSARIAAYPGAAMDGTLVLPRLIAHPLLITTLFIVAVVNAATFYILPVVMGAEAPFLIRDMIFGSTDASLPPALGFVLFVMILIFVADHSGTTIHIGRDLVDHQYFRDPKWFSVKLQSWLSDWAFRLSRGRWGAKAAAELEDQPRGRYFRRRARIQKRLEALIDGVVRKNAIDRLLFFAHSQGTVILADYLSNHDGLISDHHNPNGSLKTVKEVDVVTMGSPLTHIYEHYYGDYEPPYEGKGMLEVDWWINLWRVDDPIGQDINPIACIKRGEVCNVGISPGGHMNYWQQPEVLAILWSLIENRQYQPIAEVLGIARMPPRDAGG